MQNEPQLKKYILITPLLIFALLIVYVFFYIHDWGQQRFVFGSEVFQLIKYSSREMTLRDSGGEYLVFIKEDSIARVIRYKETHVRYGGGYDGIMGIGATIGYTFSDGTRAEAFPDSGFIV
jgi:hypothetical protein